MEYLDGAERLIIKAVALAYKVEGVTLEKVCSIKADKDSDVSKNINLRIKFDGVKLGDVFAKAASGAVINWQNGPGRSKFEQWKNGQTVEITFAAPGRTTVDPEAAIVGKMSSMTEDEKEAYIRELMAKASN